MNVLSNYLSRWKIKTLHQETDLLDTLNNVKKENLSTSEI